MSEAFEFIVDMVNELTDFLSRIIFQYNGIYVSVWGIMLGGLITSIVITVFWKGGRG